MAREKRKTDTLSLRIEPAVKRAIKGAAERERRSVAAMVEVMALAYCAKRTGARPRARRPIAKGRA